MLRENPPILPDELERILETRIEVGKRAQVELGNYLVEHRIFMTKDLWNKFQEVNQDLIDAIDTCRQCRAEPFHYTFLFEQSKEKLQNLDGKINTIAEALQARLHYEEA